MCVCMREKENSTVRNKCVRERENERNTVYGKRDNNRCAYPFLNSEGLCGREEYSWLVGCRLVGSGGSGGGFRDTIWIVRLQLGRC